MKKLTHNEIYDLVNSIQAPTFNTKGQTISFQFITDSRFMSRTQLLTQLKKMVLSFALKADPKGLSYELGQIQKLDFPSPEPSTQFRIKIWILKPKYAKEKQLCLTK